MSSDESSESHEYTLVNVRDAIRDIKGHITQVEDNVLKRVAEGFQSADERFDSIDGQMAVLSTSVKKMADMLTFLIRAAEIHHNYLELDNGPLNELAESLGLNGAEAHVGV